MSTGYGWEGLRQVCATLLGVRHVPECFCMRWHCLFRDAIIFNVVHCPFYSVAQNRALRYVSGSSCTTTEIYGVNFYSTDLVDDERPKRDQRNTSALRRSKLLYYFSLFVDES